jgi:hypothetical protein
MTLAREMFTSPELYPVILDADRRVLKFVRMSRETYRNSVFLDLRTRCVGTDAYEIRVDDLLLAALDMPRALKPVHYIVNSAYCCSTLLSRYFELLPSCFVLKEPRLLAQLAVMPHPERFPWDAIFDLCLRLLSRTFEPDQMVVMKPVDVCSLIGSSLLEQNPQATITFLMTPLRHFLLSILKSGERRDWARARVHTFVRGEALWPALAELELDKLSVAEAAACLWLIHRSLGERLWSGVHSSRVLMLNGSHLAESPKQALSAVFPLCGLALSEAQLESIIADPSMSKYSKDLSRPYDSSSRSQEIGDLERCWGAEADAGMEWAEKQGLGPLTTPAGMAWAA